MVTEQVNSFPDCFGQLQYSQPTVNPEGEIKFASTTIIDHASMILIMAIVDIIVHLCQVRKNPSSSGNLMQCLAQGTRRIHKQIGA